MEGTIPNYARLYGAANLPVFTSTLFDSVLGAEGGSGGLGFPFAHALLVKVSYHESARKELYLNNNNLNHFIIKTIFRLLKNTKGQQKIPLAVDYTS